MGILIELKAEKDCTNEALKKLATTALQQIIDKKYDTDMTTQGSPQYSNTAWRLAANGWR